MAVSFKDILSEICEKHNMNADRLRAPWRSKEEVLARHELSYLANRLTKMSFHLIGREINRDYTCVRNGVMRTGEKMDKDPAYAAEIESMVTYLEGGGARFYRGRGPFQFKSCRSPKAQQAKYGE
jgi:chromosomal replication initiator protein